MSIKTDLAKEIIDRIFPEYSKAKTFFRGKTKITRILIDPQEEKLFQKPAGRYVTIEADSPRLPYENFDEEAEAVAAELRELLPKDGNILAVGLGSSFLTADSIGPKVMARTFCKSFGEKELFLLSPGTEGRTGMEPGRLVRAAVKEFSPAGVILIDSLMAEDIFHICRTVQITDAGLAPGSGICERKNALNAQYLGVPCVAIGTPTAAAFSGKEKVCGSSNDIDILAQRAAARIAAGISLAVFPELGLDFIKETAL